MRKHLYQISSRIASTFDRRKYDVLIFAPDALLHSHFHNLCVLGRVLETRGYRAVVITCNRSFSICPPMYPDIARDNDGIFDLQTPCERCIRYAKKLSNKYRLSVLRSTWFDDIELKEDDDFDIDLIKYLALMDISLLFRSIINEQLESGQKYFFDRQYIDIKNCIKLCRKIIKKIEFKNVIIYGSYSIQIAANIGFSKKNIFHVNNASHKNIDWQRIAIYRSPWTIDWLQRRDRWPVWKDLPLPDHMIKEIGDDLSVRLSGSGSRAYSAGAGVDDGPLDIEPGRQETGRKTLVCFTSSPDELEAALNLCAALDVPFSSAQNLFESQIDWIKFIIEGVEQSSDFRLIVRVHPREGRKRANRNSDHMDLLWKNFGQAEYEHCRIIWPDDPVSAYRVGKQADLVVVAWSSVGHEFARMGLPVMSPFESYMRVPGASWIQYPTSGPAFFDEMRDAIDRPASITGIIEAFRWYHFSELASCLDIHDVVTDPVRPGAERFDHAACSEIVESVVIGGQDVEEINRNHLIQKQTEDSIHHEKISIARQLIRFIYILFFGQEIKIEECICPLEYCETYLEKISGTKVKVCLNANSKVVESPIVVRLLDAIDSIRDNS